MAKKVFVSSTSYNLEDVRSEIRNSLLDWKYVPINFESPDFPVKHDLHKHDVCLDNVKECDILILVIGSNYGSIYEGEKYPEMEGLSVTRAETRIAIDKGLQVLTFVRKNIWAERATFKENQKNGLEIKTYHADSKEIFDFIDEIDSQYNGKWIYQFETSIELKTILKEILLPKKISEEMHNRSTVIHIKDKNIEIGKILSEENKEIIILDGENELPYIESISSNSPAECVIYANNFNHYFGNSYVLETTMPHGLIIDELKELIEYYYHCFSEFEHYASAFCINQETHSWFGNGPLNFIETLKNQDQRYLPLRKNNETIHHREAACFIDETNDSIFYIHLQPNRKDHINQIITMDYVNIGLLFNNIPCSDVYNKFFENIGSIPNTIEVIKSPLTISYDMGYPVKKENIIITNPDKRLGGWVCGIVCKNSKKLRVTDIYYEKIIVNFSQHHEKEDKCTYRVLNAQVTTLPARNFPARIVNYRGRWEMD